MTDTTLEASLRKGVCSVWFTVHVLGQNYRLLVEQVPCYKLQLDGWEAAVHRPVFLTTEPELEAIRAYQAKQGWDVTDIASASRLTPNFLNIPDKGCPTRAAAIAAARKELRRYTDDELAANLLRLAAAKERMPVIKLERFYPLAELYPEAYDQPSS